MYSSIENPLLKNFTNEEISFGPVPVGTTAVKTYTIKNCSHKSVNYIVTRNTNTSPIYHVFDVNKYEGVAGPGDCFTLKITYSPNIPRSKNWDYFRLIDTEDNLYRLSVTGECIGPSVSSSVRFLNFFKFSNKSVDSIKKQVIQITNNSTVPATFQFDCDEDDQGVFQVDKLKGTLGPKKHIFVTIQFVPQTTTVYHRQLWCLVLYHEPVILNLLGAYFDRTANELSGKFFKYYPFPWDDTVSYKGYMSDSVTLKSVPPPISLSMSYFDFGGMSDSLCRTLTTCMTNHMDQDVEVVWETVKFFNIYPENLVIPAGKSALYECTFSPELEDKLHSAIINGCIFWSCKESDTLDTFNIPLSATLRLIGHSFPKNCSWISNVTIIPSTVILPLTLPGFPSWATFMIKSEGHLPVLFKLLPPKKTNFIMKPMVGLLRMNFQLIVVQLEVGNVEETENSYVEQWNIELNGQVDRLLPIYVKAQTAGPKAVFGNENTIYFDSVQPGTQTYTYIPVKNTSACQIQYEVCLTESFGMDPFKGQLAAGEETFVICRYISKSEDVGKKSLQIVARVYCIYSNKIIGHPFEFEITVKVESTYSELCAMPATSQLGEVECMTTIHNNFYLFNFGQSNVNFKLIHNHPDWDVDMSPVCSNCGPREKILISLTFTAKELGQQSLAISYRNRQNQYTEDTVDEIPKTVFTIEFNCIYPTIQIVDLVEHNYGYLFNKTALWEYFQIDLINATLGAVKTGEKKVITLSPPEGGLSDETFFLVFQIKNCSNLDVDVTLKRRQLCSCERKEVTAGFTFRQKVFCCPHKDVFTMNISDSSILANTYQNLTLQIRYCLEKENVLSYMLQLNNDRTIILNVLINSIPKNEPKLSAFNKDHLLNFGDIYIGLSEAPVMAFWLYNNMDIAINYTIDDGDIVKLCNAEDFPVLKCLNPHDLLGPRSTRPILFKFWPIEVKIYEVVVPLQLGSVWTSLQIIGKGIYEIDIYSFNKIVSLDSPVSNGDIALSVDSIIIEPILVHSSTERLFCIKNNSRSSEIKYLWKPCFVDGLVRIAPVSAEGILEPKESHMVVINITSLNEPCSIKLPLCCEYYDNIQPIDEATVKKLYISLSITLNVVGILDRDTCVPIEDQMKLKPFDGVHVDVDKFLKEYWERIKNEEPPIHPNVEVVKTEPSTSLQETVIDKDMTQYVLERVVGDVVFSNYFREIIKNLKNEPSPLYSQLKDCYGKKDKQNSVKLIAKPQLPEMANICQEALLDGIHTTFQLGPVRKS